MQEVNEKDVAISIQLTATLPHNRTLAVTTCVALNDPQHVLDNALDKLRKSVDRQEQFYTVQDLRKFLEQNEAQLETLRAQLDEIVMKAHAEHQKTGRRGEFDPKGKTAADIANSQNNVRGREEFIKKVRKDLAELEAAIKE